MLEYRLYGYMGDDGEYTGFDLELAQAVCDLEGWELVKTPINWESKDMELDSGSIDCIWNGFTMTGREDDYTWSQPYVDNSQVMVVKKDAGISALSDLAGKTVGVQAASAALQVLQDEDQQKALADTFGTLQEFADYNSAFVELQAGAVDAIAMDIGVAKYQSRAVTTAMITRSWMSTSILRNMPSASRKATPSFATSLMLILISFWKTAPSTNWLRNTSSPIWYA